MRIYPMPASDNITLDLSSTSNRSARVEIVDLAGRPVYSETLSLSRGNNELKINTLDYPTGLYIVQYDDCHISEVHKIIISK